MAMGTLTRRMDDAQKKLEKEFRAMLDRRDFQSVIAELRAAGNGSGRPSALAKLYEMFGLLGISCERDRDDQYYSDLVKNSRVPEFFDVESKIVCKLFENFGDYPTPPVYMERIVRRLSADGEEDWSGDSLRLQILKRFIKYGDYITPEYSGKRAIQEYVKTKAGAPVRETEEVLSALDDGVFDVLAGAPKEKKKPDGPYGLLRLADDLAAGRFKAGGATKRDLYLFAIVYNMTYYSGAPDEIQDYDTDIEKNLFQDYYTNNLMRFITEAYTSGKPGETESDPSGQGINYKNFAEMVYLYYIYQDPEDIPPAEKVRRAHKMIEDITESQKNVRPSEKEYEREDSTLFLRESFTSDILSLPEEDFMRYITENYDCNTVAGTGVDKNGRPFETRVGKLQVKNDQNTAYANYLDILEGIENLGVPLDRCNYGIWFIDVAMIEKDGIDYLRRLLPQGADEKKMADFYTLLRKMHGFLGQEVSEKESSLSTAQEHTETLKYRIKALSVSSPEEVTRTSLIVAYYYYYNALHDRKVKNVSKRFSDVFEGFRRKLDPMLEESGYQTFSARNIFDMAVVFSTYARINN